MTYLVETTGTLIERVWTSPAGSFASVFAILLLAGWLIWYVTRHSTKYKCEHTEHKTKVEKVESNLDEIRKDISFIKGSIEVIQKSNAQPLVQSHSPISLTTLGKKLSNDMELYVKIQNNWDRIKRYLDNNIAQKNAYDIQQFCIETATTSLDVFFDTTDLNSIKTFAFQNGNTLAYYGGMIGVLIRDKYFEYKGINIQDVDDK